MAVPGLRLVVCFIIDNLTSMDTSKPLVDHIYLTGQHYILQKHVFLGFAAFSNIYANNNTTLTTRRPKTLSLSPHTTNQAFLFSREKSKLSAAHIIRCLHPYFKGSPMNLFSNCIFFIVCICPPSCIRLSETLTALPHPEYSTAFHA